MKATILKMTREEQMDLIQKEINESTSEEERKNKEQQLWSFLNGFEVALVQDNNKVMVLNHTNNPQEVIEVEYTEYYDY